MSYYDKAVDAIHVADFAAEMKKRWATQDGVLDQQAYEQYYGRQVLELAGGGRPGIEEAPSQALSSGIVGQGVDQMAMLIYGIPFLRANPPPEDAKAQRQGDEVEAWLASCWKQAQAGPVWETQVTELVTYGRGWSVLYPVPDMWASDEFVGIFQRYLHLLHEGGTSEQLTEASTHLNRYKRNHFPIRWRSVPSRSTWCRFDPEIVDGQGVAEVVEVRQQRLGELIDMYGLDRLPRPLQEAHREGLRDVTAMHEVYVYANHFQAMTVVADKDDPRDVSSFEHGLEAMPYVLMEARILNDPVNGIRWKGAAYDVSSLVTALDTLDSDVYNHLRNYLSSMPVFELPETLNPQALAATEGKIDFHAGEPTTLPAGAKIQPFPMSTLNPNIVEFRREIMDRIEQAFLQSYLRETQSGESGTLFMTRSQIGETVHRGFIAALESAALYAGKLLLRMPGAMNAQMKAHKNGQPDSKALREADKIYALSVDKGWQGLGPKDVEGWEGTLQTRLDRELPLAENLHWARAQQARALELPLDYIYTQILHIEDPQAVIDQRFREKLEEPLTQKAVELVYARAGEILQQQTMQQLGNVGERLSRLPPAYQQALAQNGVPEAQVQANLSGIRNAGQIGLPQNPPVNQAVQTGPMPPS